MPWPKEPTKYDWPEDWPLENGNYSCRCLECWVIFIGHKRRQTCRACTFSKIPRHASDCSLRFENTDICDCGLDKNPLT